MFQKIKTDRSSTRTPLLRGIGKLFLTLFIGLALLLGAAGSAAAGTGTDVTMVYQGHPPPGFSFLTGQVTSGTDPAPKDFSITGYDGNEPPYSGYGSLAPGVTVQDLGVRTLAQVTDVPTTGFLTPPALILTPGHAYAFRLGDGSVGVLAVKSVTLSLPTITMVFDFRYPATDVPTSISFSGWFKNAPNWPSTADMTPIEGAIVNAYEAVFPLQDGQLINSAQTGADGAFTITNIPTFSTFRLFIPPDTGSVGVQSKLMNWNANIQALLPFVRFTEAQYADFGNASETGMILGRVASQDNPTAFLAGATVTAREWTPGNPPTLGATYSVTYTGGGQSTAADGVYMVKSVPDGKLLQLEASLPNYTFAFNFPVVPVQGGAVSEESFFGAPSGGTCTYALNHEVATWPKEGGSHEVQITAGSGCAWTAVSNNTAWLTVTSGASGTGNGSVGYTVAANTAAARIGTITIAGRTFAVVQGGVETITSPIVGTWGAAALQYENDPKVWYVEAAKATFYADGKGLLEGVKNDGINQPGQRIKPFTEPFTYTVALNADSSINLTINMGQGAFQNRIVVSDSGNMAIQDGTGDPAWEKLQVMVKIDKATSYSNADLNGDYYFLGFERNPVVENPPSGNGSYMAISGVHTFNGAGTYSYSGKANSMKLDGSNHIWDDPGKAGQTYAVSPDGTMTAGSGAFQGAIAGNGKIFGGSGSYLSDNWMAYVFMKKADKTYAMADLAGKWAVVGFGQESEAGKPMLFMSEIGTIACDNAGVCAFKFKQRRSDGTIAFDTGNLTLAVNADGSFGASLPGGVAFAGAIGNDGNAMMVNSSFNASEPWQRQILVGVRANSIGDLAGDPPTIKGDINGDGRVDLADAVLALKVMAGLGQTGVRENYATSGADVNGDERVGAAEVGYILQYAAGLRQ